MTYEQLASDIEAFERLKPRLAPLWDRVFPENEEAYTSIVVPSLTLPQTELARISGITYYEERLLFLLMRLRNPRARIIYVTSQPIHPEVLEYYLHLLVGVPASHARSRLTLLCVYDSTPRSLTEKILERPRLIERIRRAIPNPEDAYLTVFNSTPLERRLAVLLGVPMNAPDPELIGFGTKSGSRRAFRDAAVDLPLGFEDVRTADDVTRALVALAEQRPGIRRAVIKLNDGFSGEGNAIFEFPETRSDEAIGSALCKVRFTASGETYERYFEELARIGGVVEEYIEARGRTSPSVQLRINPRGEVFLVSTHEQILGGPNDQVYLGCRFPAADAYRNQIQDMGMRVGRYLAERGVIGRLSVDFVAWPQDGSWKTAALEINLRMGGTTHPMLALRFLTGGSLDPDSGLLHSFDGQVKFYRASDNVESERYRGLLPEDLIEILMMNRLDFNHRTGTGVLFHLIGAISEFGKVGLIAIGNSRAEAEQLFDQTIEVLDRETESEKMSKPSIEVINRETAISHVRKSLIELANGKSICQVAAERKILCGGFLRYTDEQLRRRYSWIVDANPSITRAELEKRANEWQLQRQRECGVLTSCDAQWQHYETCHGWDDFSNDALAQFCLEICGKRVEVVGEKTPPVI